VTLRDGRSAWLVPARLGWAGVNPGACQSASERNVVDDYRSWHRVVKARYRAHGRVGAEGVYLFAVG
jgi:hypothetical protein